MLKPTRFCPILSAESVLSPRGPERPTELGPFMYAAVMLDRKLLRQGVVEGGGGDLFSGELSVPEEEFSSTSWCSTALGLPLRGLLSSDLSEARDAVLATHSDFFFLFRRKFPLSNIFSQFGSRVQ